MAAVLVLLLPLELDEELAEELVLEDELELVDELELEDDELEEAPSAVQLKIIAVGSSPSP